MAVMHERRSTNSGLADFDTAAERVRQDGIHVTDFGLAAGGPSEARVTGSALKRVGKSLFRQLKLNFCRIVPEIQYASLIVMPEHVDTDEIVAMCVRARPNVELIIIGERRRRRWARIRSDKSGQKLSQHGGGPQSQLPPPGWTGSEFLFTHEVVEEDEIQGIKVRRLYRPLRPIVLNEIMRPPPPVDG
jgi:hypothetical protein